MVLWVFLLFHKMAEISHNLEVGHLPSEFILSLVPGQFLIADEELGCPRKLLDFLKLVLCILPVYYSKSREMVSIPLGLMSPLMPLTYI